MILEALNVHAFILLMRARRIDFECRRIAAKWGVTHPLPE
jgi:hypothetical protein